MDGFSSPRLVPLAGSPATGSPAVNESQLRDGRGVHRSSTPATAKTIRERDTGVARPQCSVPPSPARFPFHFCSPSGMPCQAQTTEQLSRLSATYTYVQAPRGLPPTSVQSQPLTLGVMRGLQEEFRGGVQVQPSASASHGGSDGRALSWWSGDPEAKRRRRVAGYKSYAMEARVKASIRKGFRWIKDRCTGLVRRY
ncbi:uncharacterized protein [Miscanthus floridulus]|uniref:uncharacterized protein n=1 Tax=Miscanthus floridulus TaxID=154761 RepID=UPI003457603E